MLELLSQGPPLTANPEAVGPDSWADLLAARSGVAPVAVADPAAGAAAAAAARRLSNPAQEASNFAAEGLAADADVTTVHNVLVQRLGAAAAALHAASGGTCSNSSSSSSSVDMWSVLAEAAVYRGQCCQHTGLASQLAIGARCSCSCFCTLPAAWPNRFLNSLSCAQFTGCVQRLLC